MWPYFTLLKSKSNGQTRPQPKTKSDSSLKKTNLQPQLLYSEIFFFKWSELYAYMCISEDYWYPWKCVVNMGPLYFYTGWIYNFNAMDIRHRCRLLPKPAAFYHNVSQSENNHVQPPHDSDLIWSKFEWVFHWNLVGLFCAILLTDKPHQIHNLQKENNQQPKSKKIPLKYKISKKKCLHLPSLFFFLSLWQHVS